MPLSERKGARSAYCFQMTFVCAHSSPSRKPLPVSGVGNNRQSDRSTAPGAPGRTGIGVPGRWAHLDAQNRNYRRLFFKEGRLVGACLIGDIKMQTRIIQMIQARQVIPDTDRPSLLAA